VEIIFSFSWVKKMPENFSLTGNIPKIKFIFFFIFYMLTKQLKNQFLYFDFKKSKYKSALARKALER
jgi:hypothetical protein